MVAIYIHVANDVHRWWSARASGEILPVIRLYFYLIWTLLARLESRRRIAPPLDRVREPGLAECFRPHSTAFHPQNLRASCLGRRPDLRAECEAVKPSLHFALASWRVSRRKSGSGVGKPSPRHPLRHSALDRAILGTETCRERPSSSPSRCVTTRISIGEQEMQGPRE